MISFTPQPLYPGKMPPIRINPLDSHLNALCVKGPIHDQSCCATMRVVQHDWPSMVLIDLIVNGQTCVEQNNFAQHNWSCMGRITLYPDLKTNRGAVGAFQDKTYCKIITNNDIEMKFSLYVSEYMYSAKQLFWYGKSRNNPGCATEFGTFYTAMLFHILLFRNIFILTFWLTLNPAE
jgi:hypothetical protein